MALRALVAGGRFDWSPEPEDSDSPAVFTCRVLSAQEAATLSALDAPTFMRDGSYRIAQYAEAILHALRCGLVGWRNVVGADGKPIPFVGRRDAAGEIVGASNEDLDRIPHSVRLDLFCEIKRRCNLEAVDFP
jgi:hypothetical protein